MIIDDPGQNFLYSVSIPLLTGNISCLRKLITISLNSPLSLSFQKRRGPNLTVLTPPPSITCYILLLSFEIQGGASLVIKSFF